MGNKVQGEGDYESARRYNEHVAKTVKKGIPARVPNEPKVSEQSLQTAERTGKARAKQGRQDTKDARLMETLVKDQQKVP